MHTSESFASKSKQTATNIGLNKATSKKSVENSSRDSNGDSMHTSKYCMFTK